MPTSANVKQLVSRPRRRAARAIALAVVIRDASPEAIGIRLEEIQFSWHETLGVHPGADAATVRRALTTLARTSGRGGAQAQMTASTLPV